MAAINYDINAMYPHSVTVRMKIPKWERDTEIPGRIIFTNNSWVEKHRSEINEWSIAEGIVRDYFYEDVGKLPVINASHPPRPRKFLSVTLTPGQATYFELRWG